MCISFSHIGHLLLRLLYSRCLCWYSVICLTVEICAIHGCTQLAHCPPYSSHIYQSVVDSLVHVARHLQDREQRYELMMKALQVFVQQGVEAKRASEKADVHSSHKVRH